jgi:hypothetical protein
MTGPVPGDGDPKLAKIVAAVNALFAAADLAPVDSFRVLRSVGEALPVNPDDAALAFEKVRLRSHGVEDEIRTAEGGGISDAQFAKQLGLKSRETVRGYRQSGQIFAWEKGTRNLQYPAWQIHAHKLLPGLADVLAILGRRELTPLAIANYFLSESEELDGKRPLDLLRENRVEDVIQHARRYGEIGA